MHRMWTRIAIALGQGALLWWLYWSQENGRWPGADPGWLAALAAPAVLVPFAHYLMEDLAQGARARLVLLPLALALFGFGWHHGAWTAGQPYDNPFAFALPLAVLVIHALPFLQCWLATGRARPEYGDLFRFAWRNALLLALGGVFTGVTWLLLWLWGALFRMLGITFFVDLFTAAYFAIPATAVAAGIGMQLAGSVERLQSVLRSQLLSMLKWLAPLAVLILALFTAALLAKSPELLLEQRRVISAAWLLWLVVLTVCLLNAAYQDGSVEAPYPAWLGRAIRIVVPLLLPVALLAIYAIAVRVDHYGLTVSRAWALLVALVAIAYAAGYAWSALHGHGWMRPMGRVNVAIALGTVALLTLMLSPLLSPERLSAASQQARALAARESDALTYLRFDSGRYGRERLRRPAELQDHPDAAAIREAAAAELQREQRWGGRGEGSALIAARFEVFPAGQALDAAMLRALRDDVESSWVVDACTVAEPCPVLLVDLDRDAAQEALVFAPNGTLSLRRAGDGWAVGRSGEPRPWTAGHRNSIREALAAGRYAVRDARYQLLEIDRRVYQLDEAVQRGKSDPGSHSAQEVTADPGR